LTISRAAVLPRPSDNGAHRRRRWWPVITVFAAIIALQLIVAVASIELLSSVRAYVTGESLYSKGQKDAQIHLLDYAQYHREEDYLRFLGALAVPVGDRVAREELQKAQPDLGLARRGFLQGGSHPDDTGGMVRLFRWFHRVPFMADAIITWTDADLVIEQMRSLAEQAHQRIVSGDLDTVSAAETRAQALHLNRRLTQLESRFSAQLGEASRQTQQLLLVVNSALAALLALTGLWFMRRSARVQATTEDEVRQRQESLQRLLDSTAEGLFGVDPDGRCTFINRAALQMLGYDDESELLGREIYDLIQPEGAAGQRGAAGAASMQRANRECQEVHVADSAYWRRDGTSFPVEYWSHPVMQGDRAHGAVATFFDISERLTMQAALRQGELRIAKLVDAVTDGVITIDGEDHIVLFNRAAETMFGVAAAEAIGGPIERFIPFRPEEPEDGRRFLVGDGVKKAPGSLQELIGRRANGEEFPLEASLSKLVTERGILMTVVLRDVTALHVARAERQARASLEAANRAKTEFLSRMSHELRTPLNAVLGFAQLLRLDAARPPTVAQLERIQHIENAGAHLLALVNDVLDLSRVESGQMMVSREPVDLEEVVIDALAMVSPLAAEAGVDLFASNPDSGSVAIDNFRAGSRPHSVWVLADRVRMRQVLVNLLSNAVKYNHAGGNVVVSWERGGDSGCLRIADTGLGMTSEKLERLFEPFNRLGAEKSKIEGTGIGLVLSRRLVELMDGELQIASTLGRGTVATLLLKRAEEPATSESIAAPPSQHGTFGGTLRVLYAEDDEVNVELIRQVVMLRPLVALSVATSGRRALEMARHDPPDLMLVDMNLGDMTGLELAQALATTPATADLPLVAMSADALPEQISMALAAGFESYLTKPVDFRKLLHLLDEHLKAEA
jgi:PAS domain S-box-containing protein